jgi:IclR family KDG regulon transcriptional repressor
LTALPSVRARINIFLGVSLTIQDSGEPRSFDPSINDFSDKRARARLNARDGAIQKSQLIIRAFPFDGDTVSLSLLARRAGIAKSTAHRTLGILEETGVVVRTRKGYQLGTRAFEIAHAVVNARLGMELREQLLPRLLDLYELTHETVILEVMRHGQAMCAEVFYGHRGPCFPIRVGQLRPAWESAGGMVLLAHRMVTRSGTTSGSAPAVQPRGRGMADRGAAETHERELVKIRRSGMAIISSGAGATGVVSFAAPVRDARGSTVCAISVSAPEQRVNVGRLADLVKRAADAASGELRRARSRPA